MDHIDVRREANKAAEAMARTTKADRKAIATMDRSSVLEVYRIAVEYDGVSPDMFKSWLEGWRKGFGR